LIKRNKNQALYKNLAKNCAVHSKYKNLLLAVAANSLYFLTAPAQFSLRYFYKAHGLRNGIWVFENGEPQKTQLINNETICQCNFTVVSRQSTS
jgi:hypothetical protein